MAYDEKLAQRVRTILASREGVVEKKLMGTLAFMVNDAMCCSVGPDGLLVRVDPAERDALLATPHVTEMALGSRVMKGFVRVALDGLRTEATLAAWIDRGIAAGVASAPRSKRRASPRPRRSS
jgi:hypothetical protein